MSRGPLGHITVCLSSHLLVEFCARLSLPRDPFPDLLLPFTPSDYPAALWPKPWVGCEELMSASLSRSPNADRAFQLGLSSACALFLLRTMMVMARAAVIAGHGGDLALSHKNNHLPSDYLSINTEATSASVQSLLHRSLCCNACTQNT